MKKRAATAIVFISLLLLSSTILRWLILKEEKQKAIAQHQVQIKNKNEPIANLKVTAIFESPPLYKNEQKMKAEQSAPKPSPLRKQSELRRKPEDRKSESVIEDKTIKITETHMVEGLMLLKDNSSAPLLEFDFHEIGFVRYLSMMKVFGARLFVGRAFSKSILGEAVLYNDGIKVSFIGFKDGNLDLEGLAMSRPHEIVDDNHGEKIIASARHIFGGEDIRLVLILPLENEAAFMGAIDDIIKRAGFKMEDFSRFSGRYKDQGFASLLITKGVLKDGKKITLSLTLDLSSFRGA